MFIGLGVVTSWEMGISECLEAKHCQKEGLAGLGYGKWWSDCRWVWEEGYMYASKQLTS